MALLEVENLSISAAFTLPTGKVAQREIVSRASFSVERGSILGILGESGSGKTLIALTLAGLLARGVIVHQGVMKFDGREIDLTKPSCLGKLRGSGIFLIPQSPSGALHPYRSLQSQIQEINRKTDVPDLLSRVGLDPSYASSLPRQLSGGMKQRSLLSMVLAMKPLLAILDEPTEGLDPVTKWDVLSTLASLVRSIDMGVILITHDIESLAALKEMLGHDSVQMALLRRKQLHFLNDIRNIEVTRTDVMTCQFVLGEVKHSPSKRLLELDSVTKKYPGRGKALDGVSLWLGEGEHSGIIGKSGAGKTTLLRCIAGIEPITNGRITRRARKIQLLWQDPYSSLNPYLTAKEIIFELAKENKNTPRLNKILEMLKLDEEILSKHPWELSGGQCQRVALARVLTISPQVLLADEPFTGLYPPDRQMLVKALKEFCDEEGITLLVASHNLDIIRALTGRLWVLEKGRVIEQGLTESVLLSPSLSETAILVEAANRFSRLLSQAEPHIVCQAFL